MTPEELNQKTREIYHVSKIDNESLRKNMKGYDIQHHRPIRMYDVETCHLQFDEMIIQHLRDIGAVEAAEIFDHVQKWYE